MVNSIAPFPSKTWAMSPSKFSAMDLYSDTIKQSKYHTDYSAVHALWNQPTDYRRKMPEPILKSPVNNAMPPYAATYGKLFSYSPNKQEKLYVPIVPVNNQTRNSAAEELKQPKATPIPIGMKSEHQSRTAVAGKECAYCKSVGKPAAGHAKTACPVLSSMKPCSLCGADGFDNHTETYCPSRKKITLELNQDYLLRLQRRQMQREAIRACMFFNANNNSP
ncbi:unnamed protein product [Cylicocyclus nassatus]|uniref:Nanos-type domain-containing protein n=1 Tax=Cylicocyclus nassatus TaxID=53992 RepID=A0AA36MD33_CYLNA|nr:unnamed protein product [Cylicocyclus nassatus]